MNIIVCIGSINAYDSNPDVFDLENNEYNI